MQVQSTVGRKIVCLRVCVSAAVTNESLLESERFPFDLVQEAKIFSIAKNPRILIFLL